MRRAAFNRILTSLRRDGILRGYDACQRCHLPYGEDDRMLTADERGLVVHTRCMPGRFGFQRRTLR